jgi:hypothetical protein
LPQELAESDPRLWKKYGGDAPKHRKCQSWMNMFMFMRERETIEAIPVSPAD